jgi:murein DD-endopeptidase MepM/ murein hydrolase activator NlpD
LGDSARYVSRMHKMLTRAVILFAALGLSACASTYGGNPWGTQNSAAQAEPAPNAKPKAKPKAKGKPPVRTASRAAAKPKAKAGPSKSVAITPASGAPAAVPAERPAVITVESGEGIYALARRWKVSPRALIAANDLQPPYVLSRGQRLILPPEGAKPATPVVVAASRVTTPVQTPRPPIAVSEAPRFVWPVQGRILSGFGPKQGGQFNDGINIAARKGDPVVAAADGTVAYASNGLLRSFGWLVIVQHDGGWMTLYAHNDQLLVERGDRVARGEIIARAGASGQVDTPQLHFEIRRNRTPINPITLLPRRDGPALSELLSEDGPLNPG